MLTILFTSCLAGPQFRRASTRRDHKCAAANLLADAEFFKHLLADVPARQVLAMAQQKYPEASMYEERTGRIYFAANTDGWFRWVELVGGQVMFRTVYIPSKEDDE